MAVPPPGKLLLVVLDGFGHRPAAPDNAISIADTPNWDRWLAERPHTLISGSGVDVGLPDGQMGNSEVGHMVIGAGRIVRQDLVRLDQAIEQGEFQRNQRLLRLLKRMRGSGGALHVLGLLSPGGVHSHERHIHELIRLAAAEGVTRIRLHAFLDGRDTPPKSAGRSLTEADALLRTLGVGGVASICGRYFAMDRDRRWDRTKRAYDLIVNGLAAFQAADPAAALQAAYDRGESDEFAQPTVILQPRGEAEDATSSRPSESSARPLFQPQQVRLAPEDAVIFMNFRADRARQLTRALLLKDFDGFSRRSVLPAANFLSLTEYAEDIPAHCIFEPLVLDNTLGEHLARLGKRQLRVAETEKYAHVTFFFSGGREAPFAGEERLLVPSPDVATYDLKPEMSAAELTDGLLEAIHSGRFDAIICNYANGDMVGHTGNLAAAVAAVETLDECLGRLAAAVQHADWRLLVTADHGNVEQMSDAATGQVHSAHTTRPVPLLYIGPGEAAFDNGGTLADVAPTALTLMGIAPPPEMTGRSLIRFAAGQGAAPPLAGAAAC